MERIRTSPRRERTRVNTSETPVFVPEASPVRKAEIAELVRVREERAVDQMLAAAATDNDAEDSDVGGITLGEVVDMADKVVEAVTPVVKGGYWVMDKVLTPIETGIKTFAKKMLSLPIIRHIYNLGPFKSSGGGGHGHGHGGHDAHGGHGGHGAHH